MTTPRRDPYATLIQQFLENTQNVASANEQRFMLEREERLTDEQRGYQEQVRSEQYAREDEVEQRRREQALTDAANAYRRQNAETLRNLLGTVEPDSPEYQQIRGVFDAMLQPTTLSGQEAMDAATRGVVSIDGTDMNVHELIARYQGIADEQSRDEAWFDTVRERAMNFMADGTKPAEERLAYYNDFIATNDTFFNDDVRRAILSLIGINDKDAQQEALDNRRLRQLAIREAQQGLELGKIRILREQFGLEQDERLADLTYEEAVERVRNLRSQGDITEAEAFFALGIMPDDEEAAADLAARFGYESVEAARSAGTSIFKRAQRGEQLQNDLAERQYELLGENIDTAQFNRMVANWEFERTKILSKAEDATTLTTAAFAASTQGDVGTLEMLQSLAEGGGYPALMDVDFDTLIGRAKEIRGSEEDQRAFEQWQRRNTQQNGALLHRTNLETFIEGSAGMFQTSEYTPDENGVIGLERDVDEYLRGFSDEDLRILGIDRDRFRDRLINTARRNRALQDESAAGAAMDRLMQAVPPPEMDDEGNPLPSLTQEQQAWRDEFMTQAELAGIDMNVAERVASGALSSGNADFWNGYLENQRLKSVAELNLANARRMNFETDALEEAANAEPTEGVILTDEQYDNVLNAYEARRTTLQGLIDSVYCTERAPTGGEEFRTENVTECDQFKDELVEVNQDIHSLSIAHAAGQPWNPQFTPAGGSMDQNPEILEGLATIEGFDGVRMDELNRLKQVDADSYYAILLGAQRGLVTTADDVNSYAASALIEAGAVDTEDLPGGTPLANLDVDTREWRELPESDRYRLIAQTSEFQNVVRRVANGEELTQEELRREAARFGFRSPAGFFRQGGSILEGGRVGLNIGNPPDVEGFKTLLDTAVETYQSRPEGAPDGVRVENLIDPPEETAVTEDGSATPQLVDAMFEQESGGAHFRPDGTMVTNESSGAFGVAQAMPLTAWKPGYSGVEPLVTVPPELDATLTAKNSQRWQAWREGDYATFNRLTSEMTQAVSPYTRDVTEEESRRFGEQYLNAMLREFDGNVEYALAAYNAGPGNVRKAIAEGGEDWMDHLPDPNQTKPYVRNILAILRRSNAGQ